MRVGLELFCLPTGSPITLDRSSHYATIQRAVTIQQSQFTSSLVTIHQYNTLASVSITQQYNSINSQFTTVTVTELQFTSSLVTTYTTIHRVVMAPRTIQQSRFTSAQVTIKVSDCDILQHTTIQYMIYSTIVVCVVARLHSTLVEHIGSMACCFHFGQNQFDSGAIPSSFSS